MESIIPRTTGLSNYDMLQYCESLKGIVLATKEIKVGRGRVIETKHVLKHKTNPDVIKRIVDSCEYYKSLNERDMERNERFELRDYQKDISRMGTTMLSKDRMLYLAMQVRTGKTLTSLSIAENVGAKTVLFVTKKKAMSSIQKDYNLMQPSFSIRIINYESLHIVMNEDIWDLIICDEAHSLGAFPKPSERAKMVGGLIENLKPFVILLSGTPTPESYSQMYHQVYKIPGNPFRSFSNFYRFCDVHVKVKQKKINGQLHNDYSHGLDSILDAMKPYTISYTQKQAGFNSEITEEVLEVDLKESTYNLIKRLKRDLVIMGKEETILADTPVKLMSKVHQLCSGTIKFESGNSMIVDTSKAEFIKRHFDGCKIGIFYKFKEELNVLKQVFGDGLTTELSVFEDTDKNIALQIVSGREGLSLKMAEYLVYYNIDFSATSYWQSRDRMTTIDRPDNSVYWVFSKGGIERSIYKAVTKKKDYTVNHFKKDLLNEI
jgi:hypothetical protein